MKKFLSILLAAMMVLAMATAFAAEETVVVNVSNHTFAAYQVFSGSQTEDEDKGALAQIVWGTGIDTTDGNADGVADVVKALTTKFTGWAWPTTAEGAIDYAKIDAQMVADLLQANASDAEAFAKVMHNNKSTTSVTIASGTMDLATGYYLIVDTTNVGAEGDDALNASLLQITGSDAITIAVKTDKPSQSKKVQENVKDVQNTTTTDGETQTTTQWDFTAGNGDDYNDVADYSIGDTVPFVIYSAVPEMKYYDTYKMVFHDKMSAGLTFNAGSVSVKLGSGENATILTAGTDYSVVTPDDGCSFHVEISNLKAISAATTGTPIQIDFTATLNSGAEIGLNGNPNQSRLEYSNNPNVETSTTKTPWDYVVVFTYELDVTKTKEDGTTALEGAQFVFYREVTKNGSTVKEYVKVDDASKVTAWTENLSEASKLTSNSSGLFKVIGLDDGTYYLEETVAPAGYNLLSAPIKVTIAATTEHQENYANVASSALEALTISINDAAATAGNTESGIVTTSVMNNKGASLPETGGIGTTLFYLFGSIMAAGSALILVVRRRAEAEEE